VHAAGSAFVCEIKALLRECRAPLRLYRAPLCESNALWRECKALLRPYRVLLCEYKAVL